MKYATKELAEAREALDALEEALPHMIPQDTSREHELALELERTRAKLAHASQYAFQEAKGTSPRTALHNLARVLGHLSGGERHGD